MKKYIIIISLLGLVTSVNAQTGKVGINTSTPTETLEVKGTARVSELPTHNAPNSIYGSTTATAKGTTFVATKTVVADANGVLGVVDGIPSVADEGEGKRNVIAHSKCTEWMTEKEFSDNKKVYMTVNVGDFGFRFNRVGLYPFTTEGNYFELTNTVNPYKYVSWSQSTNYSDNAEQDMNVVSAGNWTRFTTNFNATITGDKMHNEMIYFETGELFRFTGSMIRFTKPSAKVKFCMTVERLN